jgi:hypothetical protein
MSANNELENMWKEVVVLVAVVVVVSSKELVFSSY